MDLAEGKGCSISRSIFFFSPFNRPPRFRANGIYAANEMCGKLREKMSKKSTVDSPLIRSRTTVVVVAILASIQMDV